MTQASFSSVVVPFLPAIGRLRTLSFWAVPRSTTPSMMWIIW
jgi:hypothetical protein